MMDIRRFFLPTSSRVILGAALLASAALLLVVLSHWGVHLAAPRSTPRPPLPLPTPSDAAQAIASRHLFGLADKAMPGGAAAVAAPGAVRVLGVASSGPSGGGFAIVSVNGQSPVPAVEGREFAPGMRLSGVTASGIEYEIGGVRQRAPLQEKKSASPVNAVSIIPGAADPIRAAPPAGRPGSPMPGQFSKRPTDE